jgi:hypothetical protein
VKGDLDDSWRKSNKCQWKREEKEGRMKEEKEEELCLVEETAATAVSAYSQRVKGRVG